MSEESQSDSGHRFRVIREAADRSRAKIIGSLSFDVASGLSLALREFYPDDDFLVEADDAAG
ncbi:MAG: hypothetical protein HY290_00065 [Planctomycetia bacterium]|nr:hypothetical protein [Planctomycetia bacterium]